jgi:hypothetical protein
VWQKAAEFESIMRHMNVLAMEVQNEDPGAIASTWLEICMYRRQLAALKLFDDFNLSKTWTPETKTTNIPC